ncbi:MAG: hypothetical protein ABI863_12645 [Ginsengibacter sp.]
MFILRPPQRRSDGQWRKNNNAAINKDSTSSPTSSTENPSENSTGDASFSCKIDGKDFSGNGTDQILNAASLHAPGIIYFNLSSKFTGDVSADMRCGGFGFEVPDKGTTIVRGVEVPAYSIGYTPPGSAATVNYECKEMTVTITSSGGSRVTGTFSGTMIEPKTNREVPVTDGKFNIPYSSLSKK